MPSFSAVLLAGGKSRRMGRDKALLPFGLAGEVLWQKQFRKLEALQPERLLWSGGSRPGLPPQLEIVPDDFNGAGPLAGISACLNRISTDLLMVLAIDLPAMDTVYLQRLLALSGEHGIVPQRDGFYEPLAAVYPRAARDLAGNLLRNGRHRLQDFVREAERNQLVRITPVGDADRRRFANLNSPEDLDSYSR